MVAGRLATSLTRGMLLFSINTRSQSALPMMGVWRLWLSDACFRVSDWESSSGRERSIDMLCCMPSNVTRMRPRFVSMYRIRHPVRNFSPNNIVDVIMSIDN